MEMMVSVEFKSFFRDLSGTEKYVLEIERGTTARDMLYMLQKRFSNIPIGNAMLMVDYHPVDPDYVISSNDRIIIIPHVGCP